MRRPPATRRRSPAEEVAHQACQLSVSELRAALKPLLQDEDGDKITVKDARYTFSLLKAKEIDLALEGELMDLVEANMRTLYEASAQGWNRDARLEDLRGSTSRILVLRDAAETATATDTGVAPLAAYCLFRMDTEYCDAKDPLKRHSGNKIEVAYCYELQVASAYRGRGLGAFLMRSLAQLGRATKMRKVMLTAFKHNEPARRFYAAVGFAPDLISPEFSGETQADYHIMSLPLLPA